MFRKALLVLLLEKELLLIDSKEKLFLLVSCIYQVLCSMALANHKMPLNLKKMSLASRLDKSPIAN
jgi:hypothetical protein